MNNKSNARAKQLFSLPVSPLAKENGHNKNKLQQHPFLQNYSLSTNPKTLKLESNFDDDNEESSDIKEDDSGDENSPTDPTVCYLHIYLLLSKRYKYLPCARAINTRRLYCFGHAFPWSFI